jgi:predicted nicotinamide N-methyase
MRRFDSTGPGVASERRRRRHHFAPVDTARGRRYGSFDVRVLLDRIRVGDVELELLRPAAPDALIDEEAFADDEFLPYWAELWPAATALAEALPDVAGLRVIELGCGLGLPSLVAAARGADVTATDWATDAIELLRENAARNGLQLRAERWDWREPRAERYDLALAADVLYERRNVEPLVARLRGLAPVAYVGLAGRPYEAEFLRSVGETERVADRVVVVRASG